MTGGQGRRPEDGLLDHAPSLYHVVVNAVGQHSIWDVRRAIPDGWTATGFDGTEAQCLAHIEATWTDLRPSSLPRRGADA